MRCSVSPSLLPKYITHLREALATVQAHCAVRVTREQDPAEAADTCAGFGYLKALAAIRSGPPSAPW